MSKTKRHIIFWVIYLLTETYLEFAWTSTSYADMNPWKRFFIAFVAETCLLPNKIILVYVSFYIIDKFAVVLKTTTTATVLLLLLIGAITFLHRIIVLYVALAYVYNEPGSEPFFVLNRFINHFFDLVFVLGLATSLKQYRSHIQSKENENVLLKEKLESEIKFLKAQTNPHFLFNTLNNLYALARKKSDATPDAILKLSNLLRFMLYESAQKNITISKEIQMIENYIELEKMRYNERLTVVFIKKIDNEQQVITPLILLPLIENAFKHGASESLYETSITIDLTMQNGLLSFCVENTKDKTEASEIIESIGLKNIRRQLELLYQSHSLKINNMSDFFKVHLTIDLNSYAKI